MSIFRITLAFLAATRAHAYVLNPKALFLTPRAIISARLPSVSSQVSYISDVPAAEELASPSPKTLLFMPRAIAPARPPSVRSQVSYMCDVPSAEELASPVGRFRAWIMKWASFDTDQLKMLGVDAFFTYGVVSNINAGLTVALAWGTFSKASGLSPLAPGQWKAFLATYVGIYATLGSILRPFRLALAVGCTPVYSKFVQYVRNGLPFRLSRPRFNRSLALFVVSGVLNILGTFAIIGLGVWTAGVVTGVPAFPPDWKPPFKN
mmetsp:Transcript_804/g.1332  ORF Transcript_804/g.1332 Transcript_804/m.1332 type:complete len:264 (-) Transcript_804:119-910(-)